MLDQTTQEILKVIAVDGAIQSILEMICSQTGMGFSAFAIVTSDRWIAAAVKDEISFGLMPGDELNFESEVCLEVRRQSLPIIINEVANDPHFAKLYLPFSNNFQSCISFPIQLKAEHLFGTLTAIDRSPKALDGAHIDTMFSLYAGLITQYLKSNYTVSVDQMQLVQKRRDFEMRELQVAMLGHDLRNPVTAIVNAASIIAKRSEDSTIIEMAQVI